jgi:hypothetical protein
MQDTPTVSSPLAPVELSPQDWWDKFGNRHAITRNRDGGGPDLARVHLPYACTYFCSSCGVYVLSEATEAIPWRQYYLYTGLHMTVDELKAKLQVTEDTTVQSYTFESDGKHYSFVWKDE